mgnify:CR=1 FL=1
MDNDKFIQLCKEKVVDYLANGALSIPSDISTDYVYVVWLNRTLQNNKALLSTTIEDGKYYEVTYNGDKNEMYFDVYVHVYNEAIELGD